MTVAAGEMDVAAAAGDAAATSPATTPTVAIPNDVPDSWVAAMRLVARIHNTSFVPPGLRGDPNEVLACILTGQELGLQPFQSLNMINVISGRPAMSAELMRALVHRAGHRLDVVEAKSNTVTLSGVRADSGSRATVTWTLEDAERAKLTTNPAWSKYPRAMLLARATSELCRMLFADIIGGLYTEEETASIEGRVWEPDDNTPLVDPVTGEITQGSGGDGPPVDLPPAGEGGSDRPVPPSPELPLHPGDVT